MHWILLSPVFKSAYLGGFAPVSNVPFVIIRDDLIHYSLRKFKLYQKCMVNKS
ncbi:hypothetical protein GPUN_0101 [Glaciecola punicea ACAM 611]|uniref:Uncharacterized protein n=1 Tax=Glaciecola punicea ACAM 611 TaxID=1121923 RepID=H5T7H8_9ALTE|nr:hypothetical protein GPUN_0101 [Glaciecola punicea ACAM 611]